MKSNNKKPSVKEVIVFKKDVLQERNKLMKRLSEIDNVLDNVDKYLEENCNHERVKDEAYSYESVWTCKICGL